ncbi:DVU_1557 family redox protein [Candidatus Formimonas warabiya]|uniref:DVU_1557 family redox protein n=1 Tax=Formimonas warabiya TaxID=1761012 RepID=UPI001BE43557|nr:CLJU_RS11820 family redox protein [Candidatus Formimonas warabiya]
MICHQCQKELELKKTYFTYLGHSFFTDILTCPECGEVYIPEEVVKGRMAEVEMQLEDK